MRPHRRRHSLPLLLLACGAVTSPHSLVGQAHTAAHRQVQAEPGRASGKHAATGADPTSHGSAIRTSRPGLAEYTGVVERRTVQLETGYSALRVEEDSRHALGEVMLRYGIGLRSEVRLNLNSFVVASEHGHDVRGFEDAGLGVKTQFLVGKHGSILPSVSLLVGSTLPTGSDHLGEPERLPRAGVSLGWELPGQLGLTTSAKHARVSDHGTLTNEMTTATSVSLPFSDELHWHAEYAAIALEDHWSDRLHHVSTGIGYHLTHDLQLDVWTGGASHHGKREFLFGVGLSRRWGRQSAHHAAKEAH